ncbi:MAG: metal ABC transporter solute-binding protein, Zn/Mn family, partial [Halolamina sp.]
MAMTRRQLVAIGLGTAGVGALAGCLDGSTSSDGESDDTTAASSFFVFGSIASAVADDAADTELLVPVGQHGHGWEPGPRVREDIYDADLLVHGPETFQPWLDDVLEDLDADGDDVVTVDVSHDVSLLPAEGGHDHDGHDDTDHDGHDDTDHDGH